MRPSFVEQAEPAQCIAEDAASDCWKGGLLSCDSFLYRSSPQPGAAAHFCLSLLAAVLHCPDAPASRRGVAAPGRNPAAVRASLLPLRALGGIPLAAVIVRTRAWPTQLACWDANASPPAARLRTGRRSPPAGAARAASRPSFRPFRSAPVQDSQAPMACVGLSPAK